MSAGSLLDGFSWFFMDFHGVFDVARRKRKDVLPMTDDDQVYVPLMEGVSFHSCEAE